MTAAVAGFALFALLVTMAPGPDTLLVLRNCVRGGRRTGAATAVGAAVGSLAWAVAAAVGLAAALQRWDAAFTVVRLAGAAYLVVLGGQTLWAHRRSAAADRPESGPEPLDAPEPNGRAAPPLAHLAHLAPLRAFRQGLLSCLLNPKVGIFFVAVVPQFLPEGHSVLGTTLLLGAVDAVIAAGWLLLVVVCAGRLLRRLRRPRVHRNLERTTGGVLIALGMGTAAETVAG
ncbi:LysE family translocator [Streptomyces nigrescens]|uniref:LysE family translocator n=2 Tax=Streptomyces TaxID=1883 RepID=A0A640TTB6_STRNI|nr:LysE family translocator [Streptomyces libani]WAT99797.1 LysE family translocator [Streptomyces libani subsp. libani]GFE26012.1 threonine transporter RhtB [Streptomyces libani subsp. libani]GGW03902.1 threonine transporter RhtB [Streptomyces libani subsp. libani]